MATVLVQQQSIRHSATPPPVSPALSLNVRPRTPTSIPNKHIPVCPPGSAPQAISPVEQTGVSLTSLLYPPDRFKKLSKSPPIYSINGATLVAALDHLATQPMPDPKQVFPWLHGLHPFNGVQSAFFVNRKRSLRRIPRCFRFLTLVSLDGDLTKSRLRGAVSLDEILDPIGTEFIDADPIYGFSVRNFHIQTAKLAPLSDIVIYAERSADSSHLIDAAQKVAMAQQNWRMKHDPAQETPLFNTFILSDSFEEIEQRYSDLVAIDSQGQITGKVMDFFQWERNEMCNMSKTSEISKNVWLGPSPDMLMSSDDQDAMDTNQFDLTIETIDLAPIPGPRYLDGVSKSLANEEWAQGVPMQFPSSGSVVPQLEPNRDVEDFVNTIRWLYYLANPEDHGSDIEELDDIPMDDSTQRSYKILIHCADGYTESSLLAIAYFMFAEGLPLDKAWIKLHREKGRNFFAYPSDVVFLRSIQQQLLEQSPAATRLNLDALCEPLWLRKMDGSLPSRILPYMYLGNLAHANNPELLRELGIKRILSIGEPVSWSEKEIESWGEDNMMFIGQVQDNGIDPLTQEFENCLSFIEKGKADRSATLVHCRVGVSRSATICIAEVMSSLNLSFPRAYCFVRARRLNVIIQPHLRFVYELLKWDEQQQQKRREPLRRELEWASIAREIALMNKPYSRQQ
ncbi:protein tyrosine phosphatase Pps1, putative [Talaromyces marneffei ATCC 18224]|uniref:Protein tyrosine phosphatase Pps1, putative n=1 Tax=Talaromyces marneffei (strain ATCC 18224 / CBS 334.59 / QM 7333) TaxID=441960 RepID=B6Q4P9_TALMQ|nr:protein tyrosine phosphatase Pps1, putative [Talaromyces marneffei ATCC 18224]